MSTLTREITLGSWCPTAQDKQSVKPHPPSQHSASVTELLARPRVTYPRGQGTTPREAVTVIHNARCSIKNRYVHTKQGDWNPDHKDWTGRGPEAGLRR